MKNKCTTTFKIKQCKCDEPSEPFYIMHPLKPGMPMQGPFCTKCKGFLKQGVSNSYETQILKALVED